MYVIYKTSNHRTISLKKLVNYVKFNPIPVVHLGNIYTGRIDIKLDN